MLKIDLFVGRKTKESFGINRYRLEQFNYIKNVDKKLLGYNVKNKLIEKFYPFIDIILNIYYIKKQHRKGALLHLGVQGDAAVLNFINCSPVIVNCLDLIPLAYPKEYGVYAKFKNWLSMRGLKKADHIIALSQFTKKDIIKRLKIKEEKISVAYAGADFKHFKKLNKNKNELLKKFNLDPKYEYIAYLGNEEKRMNVVNQLKAFKITKNKIRNIKFIKAGKPNTATGRKEILEFIKKEELVNDIIFINYIDEKDLPTFYNAIDALMYPISYAGFGLPPLEAMACGCPVITSNLTSLPEVVGNAAIIVDPYNLGEMSKAIEKILSGNKFRNILIKRGFQQCKKFNWESCGRYTTKIYEFIDKNSKSS